MATKQSLLRLSTRVQGLRRLSSSPTPGVQTLSYSESDDIIYGPDHWQLRNSLRKIIDKDINPKVDEWEAQRKFPAHKVFKVLGSNGFLGVSRPKGDFGIFNFDIVLKVSNSDSPKAEIIVHNDSQVPQQVAKIPGDEYGGLELDYSYSTALAEELGNINCGGIPMAIGVQTDMSTPALARFGSEFLKKEFLAPTIAGDLVACLGVSEVSSGSDVASIQTRASRKGDDLIINGGKMWTTNGTQADWMCCLANTSEGKVHANKSLIVIPMKTPGVTVAKEIQKLGMWSSDTAQIFFEDVRVPRSHIIGEEGQGFMYQMLQFQEERLFATACALVPLEKMIAETIKYTTERKIFGRSVLNYQVVHFTLAELSTEVEMLRSALYRAVALYIKGQDVTKLASMCKLKAGRLLREASDKCLQYWGGMGFTEEVLISRMYRDMRLISIGAGADEVMLAIICKLMNTLPKK